MVSVDVYGHAEEADIYEGSISIRRRNCYLEA
jgi:hypothetical protein